GEQRRWAVLRLRPLPPRALLWTLAAVPALLATSWGLWEVYVGLVRVPAETLNPYAQLTGTPLGSLSLALLAVGVAPLLEEFFFRGLIQQPLERRWGPARAILFTGALFAAIHLLPWIFPLHLFLGLAFGWVVYATRSIWPGVILHAANNAAALLGLEGGEDPVARPTIWEVGFGVDWWTGLALLTAGAVMCVWVARGLWAASRS
ncbi:MAG TPA: CPBP family intramembrane glutamic endopeptidase, partial [Longimicrobiaceae bacterium]|nr:CPBP family intramembrane glutamic endopeptidase [Longimicrobiaceae bacterium]